MGDDAFLPEREGAAAVPDSCESGFIEDITQIYLHEIGATPLLSAAEEIKLALLLEMVTSLHASA